MNQGGGALLKQVEQAFPETSARHVFPFIRVRVVSGEFKDLTPDEQEDAFASALDLTVPELRNTSDRLFLRFELVSSKDEAGGPERRGETWLGAFADERRQFNPIEGLPPVVHFYGYKGGQGRSTLLAFMAATLAADGHRVLAIDVDAEAPSLDVIAGLGEVPLEASLIGLRAGATITPVPVHSSRGGGSVSILAFRPSSEEYDLDAAALAFEASVSAPSHERLAIRVRDEVARQYDVILVDHRTGLGPTVPTWVRTLPGPVVAMDRLDGQSRRAVRDVERLWRGLESPGLLVSHIPTLQVSPERLREQLRGEAWPWLEALARAQGQRAEEPLEAGEIEDHWVIWPEDNAFRRARLPELHEVGGLTRDAIARIRELLGLASRMRSAPVEPRQLHPSGATDQGLFIVTEALRELRQPGSPIRYIMGRKGTGKTRLLHELASQRLGDPLVVAEDESIGGLPAQDVVLQGLLKRAREKEDPEGFWWTLVAAGVAQPGTARDVLSRQITAGALMDGLSVRELLAVGPPRVFLIDGLESMSQREQAHSNIQGLLNVMSAIENDPVFRQKVTIRTFLRTDITRWGFQNFEQQSAGNKRLELSWSTATILNFVLSRLPDLPWIKAKFPEVIEEVERYQNDIRQGALPLETCLTLLLRIFPEKLGRKNINTTTFLRTYFSDDPSGEQSYYPRVYAKFLGVIDAAKRPLVAGRVGQDIIMSAHDEASAEFLTQVRQELFYLTPLPERDLDRLIAALNAQETPFVRNVLANRLRNSLKLRKADIDGALEAMRDIGIFEQHPSRPDAWRVGRLFKAALKMKYARGIVS